MNMFDKIHKMATGAANHKAGMDPRENAQMREKLWELYLASIASTKVENGRPPEKAARQALKYAEHALVVWLEDIENQKT